MTSSKLRVFGVLHGLAVLVVAGCDPSASAGAATRPASEAVAGTATIAPASAAPSETPVKSPRAAAPAPVDAVPIGAKFVDATEVVSGISVRTHTVISPPRTGDPDEDFWIQYQVYGEITNHSSQVFENVSAHMTFHDADGKMLGVDSIATASRRDVGDNQPGEAVSAEVHFVQPGQSVPFFFTRNLAAIDGAIGFHRLYPRRATVADDPPRAVAVDVVEGFAGEDYARKRMFSGTIRNDGEGGCRAPDYVVAFRDPSGKIASVDRFSSSDDLGKVLANGESIAFSGGVYVRDEAEAWRATAPVEGWVDCQPIY